LDWLTKDKSYELRGKERNLSIIGNKIRLGILYVLFERDAKMSFNDIAKELDVENNKLAYHIALLKKGRFVENEMRFNDKIGKAFSFYGLSEKGKKTIKLLEQMTLDLEESEKQFDDILK
jgi:predicted ArsR family transcriptional regulator